MIIVGEQINQTYLVMAMARGLDAAIVDPTKPRMMVNILTARMLLGRDAGCKEYLAAYRQGRLRLDREPS